MTAFGVVALPLLFIACLRPVWLLQLAMLFSVFEAAAGLTFGGFGLQPALMPAAIFVPYIILQVLLGVHYLGRRNVWWAVLPFLCATAWAVVGSWLLPRLFAGEVMVWPQKMEPPIVAIPLEPTGSNFNQVLYIVVDCFTLVACALFFSGSRFSANRVLKAYMISGFVAAGIGFWQLANKLAGVPYPDDFLFSNPGVAILSGQSVGLTPRINGSFSEPSAFAGFLVGIIGCTGWMILQGHEGRMLRVLFAVALVAVLCSTSTTGYGVLTLLVFGLPTYALFTGAWRLLIRILFALSIVGLVLAYTYTAVSSYTPQTAKMIDEIISGTLNKQESSSYQDRTSADVDSLNLLAPTYGFGVGWGSNRSSSLIPGTLANLGIWGTMVLVWFGWRVSKLVSRARKTTDDQTDLRVLDGATGAILSSIVGAVLSGPTITTVSFYILIAALIGTSGRILAVASARRRLALSARKRHAALSMP